MTANLYNADGSIKPEWRFMLSLMEHLGRDGTSEDETEPEEGSMGNVSKVCRVLELIWRSKDLIKYLKLIDRDRNVRNIYGNYHAGNRPRTRLRHPRHSSAIKHVPVGLPINFYDEAWYNSLSPYVKASLAPVAAVKLMEFEEEE